jgi:hypothetical protein
LKIPETVPKQIFKPFGYTYGRTIYLQLKLISLVFLLQNFIL